MSSTIAAQTEKLGYLDKESAIPSVSNLPIAGDGNVEVEEEDEEDEDVDFNPFLRGDSPSDVSSSLSSENEGPDDSVERNFGISSNGKDASALLRLPEELRGCEDEEAVMQATVHGRHDLSGSPMNKEITSSIQQARKHTCGEVSNEDLSSKNGIGAINYLCRDGTSRIPILEIDDEDAICRRTRARHSLANYTLEELETFLQGSDDDGYLPNVDDEEEYQKFLAAVLAEGADGVKGGHGDEDVDEDEDNDADFELEIEEALENDVDENVDYNRQKDCKQEGDAHMPVTRQKKRLKESVKNKKPLLGQAKMPLRPLMPYESTAKAYVFPAYGWQFSSPAVIPYCSSSASGADLITGFTAHQIGQLYCIIHEHVQLLIQVFSVSVLDPSKEEVASGVQKMISEMICRREKALGQQKVPYPEFCFHPPNLQSSLQFDLHQAADSSYWTPLIDDPVLSIIDVAPLRLVKSFMTDVSDTVLRYRQRHIEDLSTNSHLIREPLFPLPALESSSNTDKEASGGTASMCSNTHSALQVSPGHLHSKKSLASVLVESTKKQSVTLVPKDIARSAQRFYPLFNAALFPHKPPAPSVANRVLFTDAEDGLLAMGLMQYNNDWAAIQQHFLPCKSTHQIFVRQKNRSSSRAPENPIKAVRHMKTSPLTTDEKAHIYEGLKLFKNDWLSVWKFIVPHRDPSLLPRLWRIATGTQKSYKKSDAMKEKRRLYDAKRRKMKASIDDCQTSSNKEEVDNGGDNSAGDVDGEDEAYVHEAFLADSEPGSSKHILCDAPLLSINKNNTQSVNTMPCNGYISEACASIANGNGQLRQESGHRFTNSSMQNLHHPPHCSQAVHSASSKKLSYNPVSRASNSHLVSHPRQTHKSKGSRVVKLAPDLPPVNLPPSVRVISQSAFKNYHPELLASISSDTAVNGHLPRVSQSARVGSSILNTGVNLYKISDNDLDNSRKQGGTSVSQVGAEENTSESDLQMHPLLFQTPDKQLSSYFSVNFHATGSTIHNSFLRNPLQADPNLSGPQYPVRSDFCSNVTEQPEKAPPPDLCTIDFHPLLQRADTENVDSDPRSSLYQLSGNLRTSQGNPDKYFVQSDCGLRIPMLGDNLVATSTVSLTHNGKENNLDLDICLSSALDKEKTLSREHDNIEETRNVLEHKMVVENMHCNASFLNCNGRFSEVSTTGNLSLQVVPPSNAVGCQCTGDLHDDSIPGIVMEQEELSDSEEDIEHVEFEREEIDDSEEEEMGGELSTGIQNKEFPFFSSKEEEVRANQSLQSRYLMKRSIRKCEKPKRDGGKNRSRCSHPDVLETLHDWSSKKRSSESSKIHPLQTVKYKDAAASRKPRKRSLIADPSSSLV